MNQTGCPEGWATDGAFQRPVPLSCEVPLAGYYVFAMITCILAYASSVKQTLNWMRRPTHTSWFPRGPINQFLLAGVQLAFCILLGFNVVRFENGVSFSMYTILFLQFAYAYSLGIIRLVSLGEKIIPKNRRPVGEAALALTKFDGIGKTLLLTQIIGIAISSLALVILSPILLDVEETIATVGWGFKAVYLFSCMFSYWYQFERCIRAIRAVQANNTDIKMNYSDADLHIAIRKMRKHQLSHLGAFPAGLIFLLLTVKAIPANIWVNLVPMLSQTASGVYFEFSVKAQNKTTNASDETKKSSNNARRQGGAVDSGAKMAPTLIAGSSLVVSTSPTGEADQ